MSGGSQLRCYMNLMALDSFPPASKGPKGSFEKRLNALAEAGFTGVQFAEFGTPEELAICRNLKMGIAASGRVSEPAEAMPLALRVSDDGYECATLHAGWGLEDDLAAYRLIESILEASVSRKIPLYVETHRATICQDMWRTVNYLERFPEIRFNGDLSHWYAGQEMVYGGFERKFRFIRPVLDRIRFVHGRIASPGCIQVAVDRNEYPEPLYVGHFRELWRASFEGFLRSQEAEFICFSPELLAPDIYYARTFANIEESDRWEQSLILKEIAEQCFSSAHAC